jgi:hypothetical protein
MTYPESAGHVLHQLLVRVLLLVPHAVDEKGVLGQVGRQALLNVLGEPHQHAAAFFQVALSREALTRPVDEQGASLLVHTTYVKLSTGNFLLTTALHDRAMQSLPVQGASQLFARLLKIVVSGN